MTGKLANECFVRQQMCFLCVVMREERRPCSVLLLMSLLTQLLEM